MPSRTLPDPIIVGFPAYDEPRVIGQLVEHGLSEVVIGQIVSVRGKQYRVNVSYVPGNPKRERLVWVLEPSRGSAPRPVLKQEEFPF